MARVTGPFMSLDASGTIFGTLTASIWKGRSKQTGPYLPARSQRGRHCPPWKVKSPLRIIPRKDGTPSVLTASRPYPGLMRI